MTLPESNTDWESVTSTADHTAASANFISSGCPQESVERVVRTAPDRYRNSLGRYRIRRSPDCASCGKCVELCPEGVHVKPQGYAFTLRPKDHRCVGPSCSETDHYCIAQCPSHALSLSSNPSLDCIGDTRWTANLILSTWHMAETGRVPHDIEHECGSSGGFDRLRFEFPSSPGTIDPQAVDTSLGLRRRGDSRPQVRIDLPICGEAMSAGFTSIHAILGRARAATAWNTFTCTGEDEYHDRLSPYADHVIAQFTAGQLEMREEMIRRARLVELKYAQSESSGVEVQKKHIDWIKRVNPHTLVAVRLSAGTDADKAALGSYYAGADILHLDGSYGAAALAPDIVKRMAMPVEYAISKVHQLLEREGARDSVTLIVGGGARNAYDAMKAIALGADGVVIGTAELVALGCVRCGCCGSERGCPRGIACTDPELVLKMGVGWATQRLINLLYAWREQMVDILVRLGLPSVCSLRGRRDLLYYVADEEQANA